MNLSGIIPPGGKQSLIIKYATPPKISVESDAKPFSDSGPNDEPYVGEIPTNAVPPQMHQHHQYLQPSPQHPAPEIFPAPQFPLPSYHQKLVQVTVNGVPPSFDLMTFHFLSSYGRVVEGKLYHQSTAYGSSSLQQPIPSGQGMIQFLVLTENTQQLANMLILDGSVAVVSGVPVVV